MQHIFIMQCHCIMSSSVMWFADVLLDLSHIIIWHFNVGKGNSGKQKQHYKNAKPYSKFYGFLNHIAHSTWWRVVMLFMFRFTAIRSIPIFCFHIPQCTPCIHSLVTAGFCSIPFLVSQNDSFHPFFNVDMDTCDKYPFKTSIWIERW